MVTFVLYSLLSSFTTNFFILIISIVHAYSVRLRLALELFVDKVHDIAYLRLMVQYMA